MKDLQIDTYHHVCIHKNVLMQGGWENSTAFVTNHNIVSSNPLQNSDDSSDSEVCALVTAYPLLIRGFGKEVLLRYLSS